MENVAPTTVPGPKPTTLSGLALLADNRDALAARILTAREATATLDVMSYIWRDDGSGRLLTSEVMAAADRGVRVRILIDDINPRQSDRDYLALDSHPNIEVRLFNPTIARNGNPLRQIELLSRLFSMTRRMHGKAWIADRQFAIVGGRNIGDEYFDAAETNFRDLDAAVLGAGVQSTCDIFDAYWTHRAARPVSPQSKMLAPRVPPTTVKNAWSDTVILQGRRTYSELLSSNTRVHWINDVSVIADPPEKVYGGGRDGWLVRKILPAIRNAKRRVEIVSPYFIPGRSGLQLLKLLSSRGVDVAVITNSLAATDVAAVHGAYANYRHRMLRCGVSLYEFRSIANITRMTIFGSKGASLHTKAFVVDGQVGFVGSFNFDPRSSSLNAEMGILFDDPGFAAELQEHITADKSPISSYRVDLHDGQLSWSFADDARLNVVRVEPNASLRRRIIAAVVRWLPIESQL
jgi:putative cardiolipin synthase